MVIQAELLRTHWNPADELFLVNCSVRGNFLTVGLAYVRKKIQKDIICVYNEEGQEIILVLPENWKNQDNHLIEVNTGLEIWQD